VIKADPCKHGARPLNVNINVICVSHSANSVSVSSFIAQILALYGTLLYLNPGRIEIELHYNLMLILILMAPCDSSCKSMSKDIDLPIHC